MPTYKVEVVKVKYHTGIIVVEADARAQAVNKAFGQREDIKLELSNEEWDYYATTATQTKD